MQSPFRLDTFGFIVIIIGSKKHYNFARIYNVLVWFRTTTQMRLKSYKNLVSSLYKSFNQNMDFPKE